MKILILGATGFVGSKITNLLIQAGYEVTCAVRETAAARLKFPHANIIYCGSA